MSRAAAALCLLALSGARGGIGAAAQEVVAEAEVGGGRLGTPDRDEPLLGLVSVRAGVAALRWQAAAGGAVALLESGRSASQAAGTAVGWIPLASTRRLGLELSGGAGSDLDRTASTSLRAALLLEQPFGAATLRLAASHALGWLPGVRRRSSGIGLLLRLGGGEIALDGGARVLRYDDRPASLPPAGGPRWVTDLSLGVRARKGRGEASVRGGWRATGRMPTVDGTERPLTGTIEARWRLTQRVALMLAAGSTPTDVERGFAPVRSLRAGLRLAAASGGVPPRPPLPPVLVAKPLGPRLWRIELRAPHDRPVRIRGDMSGWRAVTLERAAPGAWETPAFEAPAGIWRVQVSVGGGAWAPVPGLPRGPDDFGGEASVLVAAPGV